ncbi:MAG: aspartate carbamoyltransferase [Thermomicrobiales bacterium]|nr:MAG: aspartate carbamoyltransferase [Thermomicrobiales bacterium]
MAGRLTILFRAIRTGQRGRLVPRHIVEVSQFSRGDLEYVFDRADEMRVLRKPDHRLDGRILATLFYEPSTRTRLSFESAMLRLGGNVISTENAREFSSAIKGESVEDTIRIVEGYADAIVIRHYEQGAAARAASVAAVPILNAGDGPGEHPTQALLDLYTIRHELGRIDDLRIALVGDLRYGRAVRSLAMLLTQSTGIELVFVSPPEVQMREDVRQALRYAGIPFRDEGDLAAAVDGVDVVYQTRIQKERFGSEEAYARNKGIYIVNEVTMTRLPSSSIVMHPLPRVDEISPSFDSDPRAKYFDEARNGVYVRMALLESLLIGDWSD